MNVLAKKSITKPKKEKQAGEILHGDPMHASTIATILMKSILMEDLQEKKVQYTTSELEN